MTASSTLLSTTALLLLVILLVPCMISAQSPVALAKNTNPSGVSQAHPAEPVLLTSVLKELEEGYAISFGYADRDVAERYVASTLNYQTPLEEQLSQMLLPLGLTYRKLNRKFYLIYRSGARTQPVPTLEKKSIGEKEHLLGSRNTLGPAPAGSLARRQRQTITGQVTDQATNEPLPGVNILVKSTSVGTVTDVEGNYQLNAADEATTLVFSSIGYETTEESISGRSVINLAMVPDVQSLEEVVVVGYGTQKKRDLTGSVAKIEGDQLENLPTPRVDQLLQGRAPGVNVTSVSGAPGARASIRIRGETLFKATTSRST